MPRLVSLQEGKTDTPGEPCADGSRDWRRSTLRPRSLATTGAQRGRKDPPLEPAEGAWPCCPLDFGLLASGTERGQSPLCGAARVWPFVTAAPGSSLPPDCPPLRSPPPVTPGAGQRAVVPGLVLTRLLALNAISGLTPAQASPRTPDARV